ncbi:hypothetical protein LNQ49_18350 [Flavobacterium sp. F-65]|uniref:YD repeat-containing protein n=1 Tax=Flavobacterium pisciphilum TaxID=2893755 RepID=A0ABS8MXN1_9FLAO|nr:hypothetical protein [Flavobacterium sp. F-65]MCC9073542.1 hypothetical protein [Flavobacterium sp. F-65]
MKKVLFLFSAISLVLTSCSSSDDDNGGDNSNVENTIFPKTEKYTSTLSPEENSTVTYAYQGNKIESLTYSGGDKTTFSYTGNVITKAESFEGGVLKTTTNFTYENNKLKSYIEVPASADSASLKKSYTYNADGTISTVTVMIDPTTLVETQESSSVFTLDARGNITKVVFNDYINVVEYDTKNNPFKNILGYTLLLDAGIFDKDVNTPNNFTKITETKNGENVGTTTYVNTYDGNNFLTKQVSGDETFEYTY